MHDSPVLTALSFTRGQRKQCEVLYVTNVHTVYKQNYNQYYDLLLLLLRTKRLVGVRQVIHLLSAMSLRQRVRWKCNDFSVNSFLINTGCVVKSSFYPIRLPGIGTLLVQLAKAVARFCLQWGGGGGGGGLLLPGVYGNRLGGDLSVRQGLGKQESGYLELLVMKVCQKVDAPRVSIARVTYV